jgi:hypothetical protein
MTPSVGLSQWVSTGAPSRLADQCPQTKNPGLWRDRGRSKQGQRAYFSMVTASKYGTFSGERQKPFT